VKTVNSSDLLGLLKTCGIIVIDISSDIAELSKGKEIFRSLKREILKLKGMEKTYVSKNIKFIVVISTIMTWAGVNKKVSELYCNTFITNVISINIIRNYTFLFKKHYMSESDVNNRVPNPEYVEHYEFELEVLAVNETQGVRIFAFYIDTI